MRSLSLPPRCSRFAGTFFPRWELPIPRLEKKSFKSGISLLAQIRIPALVSNEAARHCSVKLAPRKAPTLSPISDTWYTCLLTMLLCGGMIWFCWEAKAHQQPHFSPPYFAFWNSTICLCCAVMILYKTSLKNHHRDISGSSEVFKGKFLGSWKYCGRENIISHFRWTSAFLEIPVNFKAFDSHETSEEPLC